MKMGDLATEGHGRTWPFSHGLAETAGCWSNVRFTSNHWKQIWRKRV